MDTIECVSCHVQESRNARVMGKVLMRSVLSPSVREGRRSSGTPLAQRADQTRPQVSSAFTVPCVAVYRLDCKVEVDGVHTTNPAEVHQFLVHSYIMKNVQLHCVASLVWSQSWVLSICQRRLVKLLKRVVLSISVLG